MGQRHVFTATFIRFGNTYLLDDRCVHWMLVNDVYNVHGDYIDHHAWIPLRAEDYVKAPLRPGDLIKFDAEIDVYIKFRKRFRQIDYGLCKPAHVERVEAYEGGRLL